MGDPFAMHNPNELMKQMSEKLVKAKRCLLFHNWTRWKEYTHWQTFSSQRWFEMWQKRECLDCGFTQRRMV